MDQKLKKRQFILFGTVLFWLTALAYVTLINIPGMNSVVHDPNPTPEIYVHTWGFQIVQFLYFTLPIFSIILLMMLGIELAIFWYQDLRKANVERKESLSCKPNAS